MKYRVFLVYVLKNCLADHRWARADLTIISIELLTVFIAGPLAAYVCDLIRRGSKDGQPWFWASVLATGEIYGGKLCCPHILLFANGKRRVYDFRTRMADWKPKFEYEQLHVPLCLPDILQRALGDLSLVGSD